MRWRHCECDGDIATVSRLQRRAGDIDNSAETSRLRRRTERSPPSCRPRIKIDVALRHTQDPRIMTIDDKSTVKVEDRTPPLS